MKTIERVTRTQLVFFNIFQMKKFQRAETENLFDFIAYLPPFVASRIKLYFEFEKIFLKEKPLKIFLFNGCTSVKDASDEILWEASNPQEQSYIWIFAPTCLILNLSEYWCHEGFDHNFSFDQRTQSIPDVSLPFYCCRSGNYLETAVLDTELSVLN